jgi:septal ring factor EnvC (AmiA/AmiB activator)
MGTPRSLIITVIRCAIDNYKTAFFSVLVAVLLSDSSWSNETREAQLNQLKADISNIQKRLTIQSVKYSDLEKSLRQLDLQVSGTLLDIRNLNRDIDSLETQIISAEKEKKQLRANIKSQAETITGELLSAQKLGAQEPIKLLLNQEDPEKFSRMLKYYDYFLRARGEKISAYNTSIQQHDHLIQTIEKNKLQLLRKTASLADRRKNLKTSIAQRQKTIEKLKTTMESDTQKLRKLQVQQKELEDLLQAVQSVVENTLLSTETNSFAQNKGDFSWPLSGKLSKHFGSSRQGPVKWQGWLIKANAGSEVKSLHQGRIIFSDYFRGFGLLLIIDHGEGYMTLYGHNQELIKDVGDWVNTEDVIARSGNSGGLTTPGLYFEIRHRGRPKNPSHWLKRI